jgi:hypothetical protein
VSAIAAEFAFCWLVITLLQRATLMANLNHTMMSMDALMQMEW